MRLLASFAAALFGAVVALLVGWLLLKLWSGALVLATPAAHVVSWVSGWPLMQEAGFVCYLVGYAITFVLLGAAIGALVATTTRRPSTGTA
ncbi:MAG: hypothetical protein H6721_15345 [Sandaracinus sp.]|nr:hypothetical protein [Sandaracinus sp.]MCB9612360.1 hypothetical protein [Sandaracinus sp.]MCB9624230.1 hypothetical protein [Sandaracinus sp.]MCB9633490.1 hypothetical protein [Sandaracinus sp.]